MRKIYSIVITACILAISCLPTFAAGGLVCAQTKADAGPYYIMINRSANTVTVYGVGDDGCYSVPVRTMVCSTARAGHTTPKGTFKTSDRYEWRRMVDGTYAQYATRFHGQILFHSVCYSRPDPASLLTDEYNALGGPASLGCVRLQTADAKWIYDNCPQGTAVTVYDGDEPGPLGKPETLVPKIGAGEANGWDPTDPRPENPWRETLGEAAGKSSAIEGMPFTDVTLGAWYYPEVLAAYRAGLMKGTSAARFSPAQSLTNAMAIQLLYNLAQHSGSQPSATATEAGAGAAWYAEAWTWAKNTDIIREEDGSLDPDVPIQRQQFALCLYRFSGAGEDAIDEKSPVLSIFSDEGRIGPSCRQAVVWAVENSLLQGYNGQLQSLGSLTRAQAAALLQRFEEYRDRTNGAEVL